MTSASRSARPLYDQQRGEVVLEVGILFELRGETNGAVRAEPDLLAELAQHGVAGVLIAMPAAAGQAPSARVAELDEDDLVLGRKRERMRAEGARPAEEPGGLEQLMAGGQDRA
jgi:hypothetical protein